jgi:hypothetical protein
LQAVDPNSLSFSVSVLPHLGQATVTSPNKDRIDPEDFSGGAIP